MLNSLGDLVTEVLAGDFRSRGPRSSNSLVENRHVLLSRERVEACCGAN